MPLYFHDLLKSGVLRERTFVSMEFKISIKPFPARDFLKSGFSKEPFSSSGIEKSSLLSFCSSTGNVPKENP